MAAGIRSAKFEQKKLTSFPGEPCPRIPEETRLKIIREFERGVAVKAIARKFGVAPKSVQYTVRRSKEHNTVSDLPRSGRPHKLDSQIISDLKQRLKNGVLNTTQDCVNWLKHWKGVSVCNKTIHSVLKAHGMYEYVKQDKPRR